MSNEVTTTPPPTTVAPKTQNATLNNLAKKPPLSCIYGGLSSSVRFGNPLFKTRPPLPIKQQQAFTKPKSIDNLTSVGNKPVASSRFDNLADIYLNYTLNSFRELSSDKKKSDHDEGLRVFDKSNCQYRSETHLSSLLNPNRAYCNIGETRSTNNLIDCINKSLDMVGHDLNNSFTEDIISLNVDFEEEDEENNKRLHKLKVMKPAESNNRFKSNSLLNLTSKNSNNNNNVFANTSLEAFQLDLNPKKYTLELSTLSSSSSKTSSESVKSSISDLNSSNRSSLDCCDDFAKLSPNMEKPVQRDQIRKPNRKSVTARNIETYEFRGSSRQSGKNNHPLQPTASPLPLPSSQPPQMPKYYQNNFNSVSSFFPSPSSNESGTEKQLSDKNVSKSRTAAAESSLVNNKLVAGTDKFQSASQIVGKKASNEYASVTKKPAPKTSFINAISNPNLNKDFKYGKAQNKDSLPSTSRNINSLDEHLIVKIFSMLDTIDKLIVQFVCKKWHRIICSSQNSYLLFNKIEIVGNRDITFLAPRLNNSASQQTANANSGISTAMTSLNLVKFFLPSKQNRTLASNSSTQTSSEGAMLFTNADLILKYLLTRLLNKHTFPVCLCVESVVIKNNVRLTDKGVELVAAYCPELREATFQNCVNLKNNCVQKLIEMCHNLKHIDLTGCYNVSSLVFPNENVPIIQPNSKTTLFDFRLNKRASSSNQLDTSINFSINSYFYLQYVDMSYCVNVTDNCIKNVCKNCVFIKNLYLRRCRLITDTSLIYIAKYCANLRELSLCECAKITDVGVSYLADERLVLSKTTSNGRSVNENSSSLMDWSRLNEIRKEEYYRNYNRMKAKFHLKYLSLAKCSLVTDKSLINLCKAGFFEQIKYLNLRGCSQVSDRFMKYFTCSHILTNHLLSTNSIEFIMNLNLSMPLNLKSLDVSKCSITDKSIEYLCRLVALRPGYELNKLNMRACTSITDNGVKLLAINFKNLANLNIIACPRVTDRSLKDIKDNCKCCIIQHSIFSFC